MSRRAICALLLASTLGLAAAIPAAALPALPRLLKSDDSSQFAVRPATLSFGAGGDVLVLGPNVSQASFRARHDGHIRWSSWTASSAKGSGTIWINQCRPDCATGHYSSNPALIGASRPVGGRYTRLSLTYGSGSHRRILTYRLERFGSFFGWQ